MDGVDQGPSTPRAPTTRSPRASSWTLCWIKPSPQTSSHAVDPTSFCRWATYVTFLPAWVGCLVRVPSTGRTAGQGLLDTHHCHWIGTVRPWLILTSLALGQGLRHRSLRPLPTPPVPPGPGPLRTSVPDGGLSHGCAGLPEIGPCRVCSALFVLCVWGRSLFLLAPQRWRVECPLQVLATHSDVGTNR